MRTSKGRLVWIEAIILGAALVSAGGCPMNNVTPLPDPHDPNDAGKPPPSTVELRTTVEGKGKIQVGDGDAATQYADGTELALTATPDEGYMFARWNGDVPPETETDNPLDLTMDDDRDLTVVFLKADLIPGVGIGPVRLGDTWTEVADLLDAPDDLWPGALTWNVFFEYTTIGIHGSLDDADYDEDADPSERVDGLWAYDPFPGTYKGVGIGSSKDDVVDALGPPEDADSNSYWYWSRGIHWGFSGSRVSDIYVFEPF